MTALQSLAAAPVPGARRHVLLTGLSSDAHTWNLVYLQLLLEELGCRVTNLGACVPDASILRACREQRPDLVVISSLNGHGRQDAARLIGALRQDAALADLAVVIGGKLDTVAGDEGRTARALITAGFDAVFDDAAAPIRLASYVRALTPRAAAPMAVA